MHSGFLAAERAVREAVVAAVVDAALSSMAEGGCGVKRLAVSGHSLGGALAVLISIELAADAGLAEAIAAATGRPSAPVPVAVTTFGAPCVGTAAFGDMYLGGGGGALRAGVGADGGGGTCAPNGLAPSRLPQLRATRVVLHNDPIPISLNLAQLTALPYRHTPEQPLFLDSGMEGIAKLFAKASVQAGTQATGAATGAGTDAGAGGGAPLSGWGAVQARLTAAAASAAAVSREYHSLAAYWAQAASLGAPGPAPQPADSPARSHPPRSLDL